MTNSKKISWQILKKSILPVILFLLLICLYWLYKFRLSGGLSDELQLDIKKYFATIFILSITFLLQRIIGGALNWYKETVAAKTQTRLDDELIPLLRRVCKIILWITALLVILPFYGININALIAALGVSSLAIALAAQDTIANIISGFLIMIDRPFRIGDRIKLPSGEIVEVLDIGIRRSRFLAEDKAIIIVPNLDLSKSKIINYTYGKEMRNVS